MARFKIATCMIVISLKNFNWKINFLQQGLIMAKIEIENFFYDLIHCKDKILAAFDQWDEKYGEDERGALVAGIRECPDNELITLLINIQRLASGYEKIKELMDQAEQAEVDEAMAEEDDDDDED